MIKGYNATKNIKCKNCGQKYSNHVEVNIDIDTGEIISSKNSVNTYYNEMKNIVVVSEVKCNNPSCDLIECETIIVVR